MNKVLLGLALSLYTLYLGAQAGCPDINAGPNQTLPCSTNCTNISANYFNTGNTSTYSVSSIPYAPFSYTSGNSVLLGQDDYWAGVISLPFNFCFFGSYYNQLVISANGMITFDVSVANQYNTYVMTGVPGGIPTTSFQTNSIMGPYHDIDPAIGGYIVWDEIGTAPCRIFVVSFTSVPMYRCTSKIDTQQIVLYETTNVIEMNLATKQLCTAWNGGLAIEGIQNAAGTVAYIVPGRNNTQWSAHNDSWRFTPNGPSIVQVNWSGPGVNSTVTGDPTQVYTVNVCPPTSTTVPVSSTYTATATYTNCDGTVTTKTDNMIITTTPGSNGGPDQNLPCYVPGLVATMQGTASAGATWTVVPGNPSNTTVTTPGSPTTTITGFTAGGTYYYLWGVSPCLDTVKIIIPTSSNAGPDDTVSCITTPGGIAQLTAVGVGTWTAVGVPPGTATIGSPNNASTTISNFSAAGTYKFQWANGGCLDTAQVVVTVKPNAGPDKTVNCAVLTGGSATMAATGTGTWSIIGGNPGTATITSPNSPTTTITNYSAPGLYLFKWTNASGCSDTATVTVTEAANAGPDQTVTCIITPGGSATMAAVGTGTWSAAPAGNPGSATITTPSANNTTITGFTAAGVYIFVWTTTAGCKDSATVTVTVKPNAGPDKTVSCVVLPGGSATMAAAGTGTWSIIPGNPGSANIVGLTNPATAINNYTAPGVYLFKWTNAAGCSDTVTVTVTQAANAGPDQTVNCAVLPGGTATMAATGTGSWSAAGGNPGTATITTAAAGNTTITGFPAAGVYTYTWTTTDGCTDNATVTVTAKPNAGTDKNVNCAVLPGGSATMGASGTGTWSIIPGNPGTSTIVASTTAGTAINNFSQPGIYFYKWTNAAGCTDTATVTVTARPIAGANQTVTCAALPGGSATMAATGTGTWTGGANPGTYVIANPTNPTTTIHTFSAPGLYTFTWSNAAGCTASATVTVTALPDAGPDVSVLCATIPGGTVNMGGVGAGTWAPIASGNPGTATIQTASNPTTSIYNFTAPGVYTFVRSTGACSDSATITVTQKPNAGPDKTVTCAILPGGSATMAATGTGTWTPAATGNPGTATITANTNPATTITGFTAAGVYSFVWTNASGCTDTAKITVTAKPDAGPDQVVGCALLPGGTATMAATGAGTWSSIALGNPGGATITSPAVPATTITGFTAPGVYAFVWTNASGCTDTARVTVTAMPNAGPNRTVVCTPIPGGSATMSANGTGTWTAHSGNPGSATITNPTVFNTTITDYTAPGVYIFDWTNASGCTDTATVTVTQISNAGPDQTVICAQLPGGIATMAATTTTGIWTERAGNPGTTSITTPSSATTTITNFPVQGIYYFVWSNGTCRDTAMVTVTGQTGAGPAKSLPCVVVASASVTMSGTGTGTWTLQSGPGTANIVNPASPTSAVNTFTAPGVYTLVYGNATCQATTTVTITEQPDAGPNKRVSCINVPGGSVNMAAATATGTWTVPAGNPGNANIGSASSPTSAISNFTAYGVYKFAWVNGACTDTATVTVTQMPAAGPAQTVSCAVLPGGTATMAGSGGGVWTANAGNPGTAIITDTTSPTTTITHFTTSGTYGFTLIDGACSSSTTIVVTAAPDAGPDRTVCQYTAATMAAVGAGTWTQQGSTPGTATIVSPTDPATVITDFSAPGIYTFVWTNADGCADLATVEMIAKPDAGADINVCQDATATMAAVGTGTWRGLFSNPTIALITNPSSPTTTITGLSSIGIYSFEWTVNGCSDTVDVFVNFQPSVSVADTAVCQGNSATLTAVPSITGGSYTWSTTDPTQSITEAPSSTTSYTVVYTLGICSAQASGTININMPPVIAVHTVNSICTADNGIAWFTFAGNAPYIFIWSVPNFNDTIRGLAPGPYSVNITDNNGCSASASGTVGLSAPTIPITLLSEHDLKCNSDSTGSITIQAVDSGAITYAWNPAVASGRPGNIAHLVAGSYSVTVTDQFGCTGTAQYTVNEPTPLSLAPLTYSDPICPGSRDGTASGVASGGSGAYQYTWDSNPVQNTPSATGLPEGNYTLQVTDDSSCVVSGSVVLVDPQPTTFGSGFVTDTRCFGDSTGTAQVSPQGAFGPYQYLWNDAHAQITALVTGLPYGTWEVTVTDSRGCTVSTSVNIGQPSAVSATAKSTNLTCYQNNSGTATASATGGTVPYSYLWSNEDSVAFIQNLQASTYFVTVTDGLGCTAIANTTLTEPPSLILVHSAITTNCATSVDGSITVTATGGQTPMTYSLQDVTGQTIQRNSIGVFQGLGPTLFRVIATDANGCSAGDTVTVPRAPFNVYTALTDSTSCFGPEYRDGRLHLAGLTLLNAPFQYAVDNGAPQFIPDFYDLSAGVHDVVITDAHGCDTSFTVIVGEPMPASVDILPGDSTIDLGSSLQLTTAFRPYNVDSIKGYAWSPAEGLSCIDCPSPVASPFNTQNTYTVTVTYNQGCLAVTTVHINVDGDPPMYIPNAFTPNGDGVNDEFLIFGEGIKTVSISIFNRWGERVFESDNQSLGWDGVYKALQQPPGVYVYTVDLEYLNGHKKHKDGSVTLIR